MNDKLREIAERHDFIEKDCCCPYSVDTQAARAMDERDAYEAHADRAFLLSALRRMEGAQELKWRRNAFGDEDHALYLGGIYVGSIIPTKASGGPYRAWLATDEDGERIGDDKWPTVEAAREALFEAARAALAKGDA